MTWIDYEISRLPRLETSAEMTYRDRTVLGCSAGAERRAAAAARAPRPTGPDPYPYPSDAGIELECIRCVVRREKLVQDLTDLVRQVNTAVFRTAVLIQATPQPNSGLIFGH